MTLDAPDTPAHRDPHPVLNALTALSALVGLALGVRLAWAGHDPLLTIGGGIVLLPLGVRLAGRGLVSLARRHGWPVPGSRSGPGAPGPSPPPEMFVSRGRPEVAVELYRMAAERDPTDPEPWLAIARIERLELKRPARALRALEEARDRLPADSPEAGRAARRIAELHLGPLENPRAAMAELARVAEILDGTTSGEWARRELDELKSRLAAGELDRREARTPPRPPRDLVHELDLLLRTRYGLIHLQTDDEDRAESLIRHVADRRALPLLVWTATRGLTPPGSVEPIYDTLDPRTALRRIELGDHDALYHLRGLPRFLEGDDPALARHLADATRAVAEGEGAIVTTGPGLRQAGPLRGLAAVLRLPEPDDADYRTLLARVLRDVDARMEVEVKMTLPEQDRLVANLRGLTLVEAERILTRAIIEDGRLAARDIESVIDAKRRVAEGEGGLEYFPTETAWTEVADLAGLKAWLEKRRAVIREPGRAADFGLPFPKGILLLGVPGCGKSLCARAVAMEWGLPLLKLDPSNLYDKRLGESEQNVRNAVAAAERMAPLVLWIDEIEKAFGAGERDGGVSRRILGTFLSWMQDREGGVFVVATANDVERIPPELLRKGRFDEIFFVDLPDAAARAEIFGIHLAARGRDPGDFDLERLARATEGFSGAEIEEVVSTLYHAFSTGDAVTAERLLAEAERTRPLSVTRAEEVEALRGWARGRTRSASAAGGS